MSPNRPLPAPTPAVTPAVTQTGRGPQCTPEPGWVTAPPSRLILPPRSARPADRDPCARSGLGLPRGFSLGCGAEGGSRARVDPGRRLPRPPARRRAELSPWQRRGPHPRAAGSGRGAGPRAGRDRGAERGGGGRGRAEARGRGAQHLAGRVPSSRAGSRGALGAAGRAPRRRHARGLSAAAAAGPRPASPPAGARHGAAAPGPAARVPDHAGDRGQHGGHGRLPGAAEPGPAQDRRVHHRAGGRRVLPAGAALRGRVGGRRGAHGPARLRHGPLVPLRLRAADQALLRLPELQGGAARRGRPGGAQGAHAAAVRVRARPLPAARSARPHGLRAHLPQARGPARPPLLGGAGPAGPAGHAGRPVGAAAHRPAAVGRGPHLLLLLHAAARAALRGAQRAQHAGRARGAAEDDALPRAQPRHRQRGGRAGARRQPGALPRQPRLGHLRGQERGGAGHQGLHFPGVPPPGARLPAARAAAGAAAAADLAAAAPLGAASPARPARSSPRALAHARRAGHVTGPARLPARTPPSSADTRARGGVGVVVAGDTGWMSAQCAWEGWGGLPTRPGAGSAWPAAAVSSQGPLGPRTSARSAQEPAPEPRVCCAEGKALPCPPGLGGEGRQRRGGLVPGVPPGASGSELGARRPLSF